ncbi:DUF1851 domain-containing protein [Luteolibacter arcticus]|uniref:DUF1851 domain-containing protein n=1 Tax=Luteolibacter arcticus TaxID=1581411 RepID=A0ABT3GBP9_9BACT|nr:DUF1851 domain-containing protein [Luteolibacter arcticus]MCW1921037.1 DUF1851 domain-containing protein [Luteolibacter arcticus]
MQFDEPKVIEALSQEWGWILPEIRTVMAVSTMGNVFLADSQQSYWRICPEELSAAIVARTPSELESVFADPESKADWQMWGLVSELLALYGEPEVGECFGLVIPALLGGDYAAGNIRRRCLYEYLGFTGDLAQQTKDLKDGETIKLEIV